MTPQRRLPPTPALAALTRDERATVLARLLASHPDLLTEAEQLALAVLGTDTIEGFADNVAWARAPSSSRISRRGRVESAVAGTSTRPKQHGSYSPRLDPYVADLRRRAMLGLVDSVSVIATGIVAGLYRSRAPADGTVAAYAGPDAIAELADQSLRDARELGVEIPSDAAASY